MFSSVWAILSSSMSGDEAFLSCPWHILCHNLLEKLVWARGLIQAQCRRKQPVITSGAPFCSAVLQWEGVQVTHQSPTMMKNASHSGISLTSYPQASSWFMGNPTFPFGLCFFSLDNASFAYWMSAFLPVIGTWGHGDICSVYSPTLFMSPVWFWVQCFIWLLHLSHWAVTYFILTSVGIVNYALIEFSLIFVPYVNTWKIILYLNQSAPNSFLLSIYNYFPFLLIFFYVPMNLENLSGEW